MDLGASNCPELPEIARLRFGFPIRQVRCARRAECAICGITERGPQPGGGQRLPGASGKPTRRQLELVSERRAYRRTRLKARPVSVRVRPLKPVTLGETWGLEGKANVPCKYLILLAKCWRRGAGSNRRIKVLQTSALPLGYRADARKFSRQHSTNEPEKWRFCKPAVGSLRESI